MIEILLFFIAASLLLYVILGGADYGAGILELIPMSKDDRDKQKHLINEAMGPVWEANHMWLILIVVILFMGFPTIFTTLMTALHLPMLALLVGIVIRGCVFTFRHYDAVQEPRSQRVYTVMFAVSSLWTSVWLGIIVASLGRGLITTKATEFQEAYVDPWWGLHPFVTGLFIASIFAFLASVYLIEETKSPLFKRLYRRRAFAFNVLVVLLGGLVFATSALEDGALVDDFFAHPIAIACMVTATLLFAGLWLFIRTMLPIPYRAVMIRVMAAGQITLVLAGWFFVYAPNALLTREGPLSFFQAAAPDATLRQLVIALLVGSLFIFPSLFVLIRVFKVQVPPEK